MNWSHIDAFTGSNPLEDMEYTIRTRLMVVVGSSISVIGLALFFVQTTVSPLVDGFQFLGAIVSFVSAVTTVAGIKFRKPNLALSFILICIFIVQFYSIYSFQGTFLPALVFMPAIALVTYLSWGTKGLWVSIIALALLFGLSGYWIFQNETAPTYSIFHRTQILLIIEIIICCVLVFILTSSFRSALIEASQRVEDSKIQLAGALDEALSAKKARSQFLANMSHEIRTPLNGVLGIADVMKNTKGATDQQLKHLQLIQESGETLLGLLNGVLDIAKLETDAFILETQSYDLEQLVIRTGEIWRIPANDKNLKFEISLENVDFPTLFGDPNRVKQILNNLIGNAIKFTQTGQICISLNQVCLEGQVQSQISVSDTGVGISEEKQKFVFKAFHQADSSTTRVYGGTGLGLSISQQLASRMKGQIKLQSTPGQGSVFTLVINDQPCFASDEIVPENTTNTNLIVNSNPGRILIVDDVLTNRIVLCAFLNQVCQNVDGCIIDCAEEGKEAIEMARNHQYNLILMDIQMPKMDGITAMKQIHAIKGLPSVPIIAVTARVQTHDESDLLAQGFAGYLPKPISRIHLINILNTFNTKLKVEKSIITMI